MRVRSLLTYCECGGLVPPTSLAISEDYTLIVEGLCVNCGEKVHAQSTLKELYETAKDLKKPNGSPLVPPLAHDDSGWLKNMGIKP